MMTSITAKVAELFKNVPLYYKFDSTSKRKDLSTCLPIYFDEYDKERGQVKFFCWSGYTKGLQKNLVLDENQVLFVPALPNEREEEKKSSGVQLAIFGGSNQDSPRKVKRGLSVAKKNAKSQQL